MPDPNNTTQTSEQIAAANPPVSPQPILQTPTPDIIDRGLTKAAGYLQGIRARFVPSVQKFAQQHPVLATAVGGTLATALAPTQLAMQTPQGKAVAEEATSTVVDPEKRRQFIQSLPQTAMVTEEGFPLDAPELKGLRTRIIPEAAPKSDAVYRARPVGQEGIPSESHAQATASSSEAHQYAQNLEDMTGKPHEVVKVDLSKVPADKYSRLEGPHGNDWVKFHEPVSEKNVSKQTPKDIIEDQGLKYKGELTKGSGVHMFEHPDHPGLTASLDEKDVTPEKVSDKMNSKLQEFGVAPKETQTISTRVPTATKATEDPLSHKLKVDADDKTKLSRTGVSGGASTARRGARIDLTKGTEGLAKKKSK